MFIQTQDTPNPHSLKFIPGRTILEQGTANLTKGEFSDRYPLAQELFKIEGVVGIFLSDDFVTVTKSQAADWEYLKPVVLVALMDFFASGKPVALQFDAAAIERSEDSEIVKQIREIIEQKVRPAVAEDGGDIIYRDFIDGVVYLELHGACSGCPSSTITLKNGIENMLKHYVPEVKAVEAIS